MTEVSVPKIIFISLKVLIISTMLLLGLRAHLKMPTDKRNYEVISLMVLYLILLIVITIVELIKESIPTIFIILVITSGSQVYQVNLFLKSCKDYIQPKVYRRNQIILFVYFLLYCSNLVMTFSPRGVGAKCGVINVWGVERVYPLCF